MLQLQPQLAQDLLSFHLEKKWRYIGMAEEEVDESPSNKKTLIIFIVLGVLLVATSIGVTVWLMNDDGPEEDLNPAALYFAINPKFQTNYEVNGRQRLFQLAISLMTREQDVIAALVKHAPTIKSKLVILLSGQQFDVLKTPDGRLALKLECLAAVQEILSAEIGKPGVEKVLFTDFVMQ